ncbi:MAG: hypothetical protein A2622_04745 [Bdellovibrionales bacterium RIFCSPHIGHO2_01_FULL_40_29]|nr:MAG: hypothetical protein A2622_04745 [Bdellovibrionales bacterium RIFCSPHIGHO2_01_FULL_40_29]OFZ34758.1 MAG: hypothetical protein A3D17_10625 [Bdellovibrionales bacterium RIFCSPHIGHO2_02_FULL_40_15]
MNFLKTHLIIFLTVTVFTLFCGCVSLERDIYFRTNNPELSTVSDNRTPYPQKNFGKVIVIKGQIDRKIYWSTLNQASGSYLWGIVVPIVPVFFYPGFHFNLDEVEKLRLECYIDYDIKVGPDYLQTAESIRVHGEGKKIGPDVCLDAQIVVENQPPMKPIKVERTGSSTVFTFDIAAAAVRTFTIDQIRVKLRTGETSKIDNKFEVTKRDWTRLYFPPINN